MIQSLPARAGRLYDRKKSKPHTSTHKFSVEVHVVRWKLLEGGVALVSFDFWRFVFQVGATVSFLEELLTCILFGLNGLQWRFHKT